MSPEEIANIDWTKAEHIEDFEVDIDKGFYFKMVGRIAIDREFLILRNSDPGYRPTSPTRYYRNMRVGDKVFGYQTDNFPSPNEVQFFGLFTWNIDLFILVYSVSDPNSLEVLSEYLIDWCKELHRPCSNGKPTFMLVGMKSDLKGEVSDEMVEAVSKQCDSKAHLRFSAKLGHSEILNQVYKTALLLCLNKSVKTKTTLKRKTCTLC